MKTSTKSNNGKARISVTEKAKPAAKPAVKPAKAKTPVANTAKTAKSVVKPQVAASPVAAPAVVPIVAKPATKATTITVTTESIAARAYLLWEQAGRPHGRDVEYWLQAETQIKLEAA